MSAIEDKVVPDGASPARRRLGMPDPLTLFAMVSLGSVFLLAALAPLVSQHAPNEMIGMPYDAAAGLLGTDVLGRDLFSRLLYGARYTLVISFVSTTFGFVAGAIVGMVAAETGGRSDAVIVWLIDIMLGIPPLMLGLVIIAGLSPGLDVLIVTIAIIHMPRVARVTRSAALNIAAMQFVEVSRARGEPLHAIILRDILPNCVRPLGIEYGMRFTYTMLFASGLSFLGLGIQPPGADWGMILRENLEGLQIGVHAPVMYAAGGIALVAVCTNLIVEWLSAPSAQHIPRELL